MADAGIGIRLNEVVDHTGAALNPEIVVQTNGNSVIAPWLDEPPTPPPKSGSASSRSFGFVRKASLSTFTSMRQGSVTNILSRQPRKSDSHSTLSIPDEARRSEDNSLNSSSSRIVNAQSSSPSSSSELRKPKSSVFSVLKRRPSRTGLKQDKHDAAAEHEHPSLRPPAPPLPDSVYLSSASKSAALPLASTTTLASSSGGSKPRSLLKREKKDKKKKTSAAESLLSLPAGDDEQDHRFELDTNLDSMDGIIDLSTHTPQSSHYTKSREHYNYPHYHPYDSPLSSEPSSGGFYGPNNYPLSPSDFRDPFQPQPQQQQQQPQQPQQPQHTPLSAKRRGVVVGRRPVGQGIMKSGSVPPVTFGPSGQIVQHPGTSFAWTAPQSWWVVEKDGADGPDAGESSSSDESVLGGLAEGRDRERDRDHRDRERGAARAGGVPPPRSSSLVGARDYPHGHAASSVTTLPNGIAASGLSISPLSRGPSLGPLRHANSASSNDGSTTPNSSSIKSAHMRTASSHDDRPLPLPPTAAAAAASLLQKQRTGKKARSRHNLGHEKPYTIRIYRPNNTFHIASITPHVNVASLTPALNEKLLLGADVETHRLYLKERGRERILGQNERPADIVRRRLEQAGYDPADGLELLGGEGLSFLLRFVYKSELLGPAEEELNFESFDYVDLTARGLRTIPVILHQHADSIISLRLSRNPMLEIPLDFIQSCTTLRELRLSHMSMKRVPQSVHQSATLHRLDLSSNRISSLDDAVLDKITGLTALFVQNNRIETLPWYFPRLRNLATLNISNNKFRTLPTVICQLENLRDLDVSFNMISELPDEIGELGNLERLIIVGNQCTKLPDRCVELTSLRVLDCRRNAISDLGVVLNLPQIQTISSDHNAVQKLEMALGPCLSTLDASHNEITKLSLVPGPLGRTNMPYALTSLDISHAKLSSLDDLALSQLSSLRTLRLDHNSFRALPETLGDLTWLETLSCSDNKLDALPKSIGKLRNLMVLDAHNNCLRELPVGIWYCASLWKINVTSNFLAGWHDPPPVVIGPNGAPARGMGPNGESLDGIGIAGGGIPDDEAVLVGGGSGAGGAGGGMSAISPIMELERKTSTASLGSSPAAQRFLPPLAHSLERLYLGENRLADDTLHALTLFKELRVLNLSFNELQDMPLRFFKNLTHLEELYLSGNKLASVPTEDLYRLTRLGIVYLNGNRFVTLPQELAKLKNLSVLDVGSNLLKYNINNWEFDWNWNFNKNLKYLNLSGNNRLQIKADPTKRLGNHRHSTATPIRQSLSGFTDLSQLRVLGLMDVTITTTGQNATVDIPDESDDRRVRTSLSMVNGMMYGIADSLGKSEYLNMIDLVHEFRDRKDGAIFAMFGRTMPPKSLPPGASPNRIARFLRDRFIHVFLLQLNALKRDQREGVPDALRRTFLKLNQDLHDSLFTSSRKMSQASHVASLSGTHSTGSSPFPGSMSPSPSGNVIADPATLRSGASGIVVYFVGKTMYVANVGNALAVVSRQGIAQPVSRKHDPYDRSETARIRAAEGWVSPPGLVNDEVDMSRAFGFYHLLPVINARPDVFTYQLSQQDEFVIIANRGLWDYVSHQTAVDIARTERGDPMIAAQKLRDFAISYGADGSTMIMVIGVAESPEIGVPKKKNNLILDRMVARLDDEVPPPVGHIALVFSDIRNSTHLWEVNPGMATAHRLHNTLLRRQLRFCGGYEVKTEGDSFMCSFPTALAAVWWCLSVQHQLLHESWPLEILECEDGKPIYDTDGRLIARGLSVRMGIHCGSPSPELDPITGRMDYFGSMVNRSARICGNAAGGQIMCSADIIREINATVFEIEPETEYSKSQPPQAVDAIREMGVSIVPVGEVKLKGLEVPEYLSLLYPTHLLYRQELEKSAMAPPAYGSRVPFNVAQMQDLGVLCLRLETLTTWRIFKTLPERKGSIQTLSIENDLNEPSDSPSSLLDMPSSSAPELYGDPSKLLPPMNDQSTDAELMMLLDSLSVRIQNAASTLERMYGLRRSIAAAGLPPLPPPPPRPPFDVPELAASHVDPDAVLRALKQFGGFDERTLVNVLDALRNL